MTKEVDLNKTVYELTEEYPELIDILKNPRFLGIGNPLIRNTLGRQTTILEGCEKQGKGLEEVINKLKENGFALKS